MIDYQKYINALRKCAKEHENDIIFTGHADVTALCRDTADLLEEIKQDAISREKAIEESNKLCLETSYDNEKVEEMLRDLPPVGDKSEWQRDHEILRAYSDGAENVLDNLYADIQKLRGCSCSCSDGVIDDVEDILDNYRAESESDI